MTGKYRNHTYRTDPAGPLFGTLFCHFFLKTFRFFLEGLAKVEHHVSARVRGDFGATLPGESIKLGIAIFNTTSCCSISFYTPS